MSRGVLHSVAHVATVWDMTNSTGTAWQIGDTFTVKGGAVEYRVVRVGEFGGGRTVHGVRVDGRLGSTLYFRPERIRRTSTR